MSGNDALAAIVDGERDFVMGMETWRFAVDPGFAPPKIVGLAGWLPQPSDHTRPATEIGRMEMLVSFAEDGIITADDFSRLASR